MSVNEESVESSSTDQTGSMKDELELENGAIEELGLDFDDEDLTITEVDKEDLLAEDEKYVVADFSFSDLIEEIESDISYFDKEILDDDKVEFAHEASSPKSKDKKQLKEAENSNETSSEMQEDSVNSETFELQQRDRLREKHLILGLKFYQEQKYEQAVDQFLKVVKNFQKEYL